MIDVPHWFLPLEPSHRVCRTCGHRKPADQFRSGEKDKNQCLDCKRKDDALYRMRKRRKSWAPLIRQAMRNNP